jgi:hypothetical protein
MNDRRQKQPRGGTPAQPNQPKRGRGRRRKGGAAATAGPDLNTAFWGDPAALPSADELVRITKDPSAVVRSLGRPPLPAHETIAVHYFEAVYDRTVTLATALAAAGEMIEPEELHRSGEDD